MKNLISKIISIAIIVGILYGIYSILPEYPQNAVKAIFQPLTNEYAKQTISKVQNSKDKDLNDTYLNILESNCNSPVWVYEKNELTSEEKVVFYGTGVYLNLKDISDYDGLLHANTTIKIEFIVKDNIENIIIYVSNFENPCDEKIETEILKQLKTGN